MAGVRLPEDLEQRLNALSAKTHRPKSYYLKEALLSYLNEYEQDLQTIAAYEEQMRNGTLKTFSLQDIKERHNLD